MKIFISLILLSLFSGSALAEELRVYVNNVPTHFNQIITVIPGDELRFEVTTAAESSRIRFNIEGAYRHSEWRYTRVNNGQRSLTVTVPDLENSVQLMDITSEVKNGSYQGMSEDEFVRSFGASDFLRVRIVPPSLLDSYSRYALGSNALLHILNAPAETGQMTDTDVVDHNRPTVLEQTPVPATQPTDGGETSPDSRDAI